MTLIAEKLASALATATELLESTEGLATELLLIELMAAREKIALLEITAVLLATLDDGRGAALAVIRLELETASALLEREMLLIALELGGGLAMGDSDVLLPPPHALKTVVNKVNPIALAKRDNCIISVLYNDFYS